MSSGFARAVSLFSIVPVRIDPQLRPGEAARALLWLPALGALIGAAAGGAAAMILQASADARLVAGVAAVAVLAILTRALHLDGLADTMDGLGSRARGAEALAIMKRSDIGPFGVIALILVLGADVSAIAESGLTGPELIASVAVAQAAGRAAAVASAIRTRPPAPGSGFGALVAGSISPVAAGASVLAVLAGAVALAQITGADPLRWLVAAAVGLLVAWLVGMLASRRIGGTSGDVFGAVIEIGVAVTLVGAVIA